VQSFVKYIWKPNTNPNTQEAYCRGVVKVAGDTIRIPTNFVLSGRDQTGQYKAVSYTNNQKIEAQKRLMSLTYANRMGNGDSSTYDGYNFRGRGAVHLTGREAYQKVSQKANSLFHTNFNWEASYDNLKSNKQEIIYSGIAFFVWKLNNNLEYLQNNNCTSVSLKVNGGDNGLPDRKAAFNLLLNADLFDCIIPKE
jgi:predicted chitinase